MTGPERNRLYRKRQRDAVMTAYGKPAGQRTAVILKALARQLAQLDDSNKTDQHDALRYMAEAGMRELCQRYGLHPESTRETKVKESTRRTKGKR